MTHSEQPKIRSIPALKGSIGLFISPQGEIVEVEQSHINTVILYPARFGITIQEIESVYAKHKEPVGVEGSAREEILCNTGHAGLDSVAEVYQAAGAVVGHRESVERRSQTFLTRLGGEDAGWRDGIPRG